MQELKIQDNTILIVPKSKQYKIIKEIRKQKLLNIKIMTQESVQNQLYFEYDIKALYYLMKKYHYQYDVAKMYLTHLYEVEEENFGSTKIQNIISIKKELKEQGLLKFNHLFHEYLKDKIVFFYQEGSKTHKEQHLIKELRKKCEVVIYQEESHDYAHECIWQLDTMEEEVIYVATKICHFIKEGTPIQNIKLCKVTKEYIPIIKRVFEWYHIPITFCDNNLYATTIGQDFLKHLSKDALTSLKYLEDNYSLKEAENLKIYNQIITILNQYIWAPSLLDVKSFLIEDLKKTKIEEIHYQEEVSIIESLSDANKEDIVFLLGFNQGEIPKTYKDESYFNDTLKEKLNLDTTNELNYHNYEKWLREIKNTKNLVITTKKNSTLGTHYLSSLNDDLKLEVKKGKITYFDSHLFNQIKLTEKIDTFVKYNEKTEDLELLYSNYPSLPYGTFNSNYQQIDKEKLKNYLNHHLTLSYSAMNTYYQCAFRYYLSNILKLNICKETFYTILGNLFHHILSIALQKEINLKEEYQKYIEKCTYTFNSREKFFLKCLEKDLEFIIQMIKNQEKTNSLKELYLEEKMEIPKSRSDTEIVFKGFVDKIYTNKEKDTVAIIDYKTGNPDLNLNHVIYGLDLQLPVYIYLAKKKFPNASIAGFYLQKILNNEINKDNKHTYEYLKQEKLKLQGYSNSDTSILEKFDSEYYESKTIKGMRTTSKGIASKKILNNEQINFLNNITESKIEEAITSILKADFEINPKRVGMENLGCKYCHFKDICFRTEKNIQNLKEYKNMEFLGGETNDTEETY